MDYAKSQQGQVPAVTVSWYCQFAIFKFKYHPGRYLPRARAFHELTAARSLHNAVTLLKELNLQI